MRRRPRRLSGDAAGRRHLKSTVDARDEGADILILVRTDARATDGLDEAIARCQAFADVGADILFLEAPRSEREMAAFCEAVPGPKLANLVEGGDTPLLPPERLEEIGYKVAAYPLTLLSAATAAMLDALRALGNSERPERILDFERMRDIVGFDDYDAEAERYCLEDEGPP